MSGSGIVSLPSPTGGGPDKIFKLLLHDFVAFTSGPFHGRSVQDDDLSALAFDKSGFLQMVSGGADRGSASSQQIGEQFLREREARGLHSILSRQEPTAETLFQRVKPVTNCRLRHLRQPDAAIGQEVGTEEGMLIGPAFRMDLIEGSQEYRAIRSGVLSCSGNIHRPTL